MGWDEITDAIKAQIAAVSPDHAVTWRDDTRSFVGGSAGGASIVELLVTRIPRVGTDETDQTLNTETDRLEISYTSQRLIVVEVVVKATRQKASLHARSIAENIRTGLQFDQVRAAFAAVGLSVASVGDIVHVDAMWDQRMLGAATFEITFNACIVTTNPVSMDWFERAELSSHYTGPDGVEYPSTLQITDKLIGD